MNLRTSWTSLSHLIISASRSRTFLHPCGSIYHHSSIVIRLVLIIFTPSTNSDAPHIPSFPRNVDTVRRPAPHTERRKEARERRRERKEEELKEKREDVKRLKGLKMKEMKKKLEMIGKEGGWKGAQGTVFLRRTRSELSLMKILGHVALEKLDLEGDWDSAAYDAQMQAILAEVEGNMDESADVDDDKPTWDDDIDVGDIMPPSDNDEPEAGPSQRETDKKKKKKKKKGKGGEDADGGVDMDEMDAERMDVAGGDGAGGWDEEEWDGTEEMRKRVLDKYMGEMLGLEFNDVVCPSFTFLHAITAFLILAHKT